MIKVESKLIPERRTAAFSLKCNDTADLKVLDLIQEALAGGYELRIGFESSNNLVVYAVGMPDVFFDLPSDADPIVIK